MSNNITTPAVSTKRPLKFYTKQEMKELAPFIKNEKQPTKENLVDFCEKYERNFESVRVHIYTKRKNTKRKKALIKGTPNVSLTPTVKDKTTVNLSKGEFKIPITNWNVSNENGQFYFVVKF